MNKEELLKLKLKQIEEKMLSSLPSYKTEFVPIETNFGTEEQIWTVSLNTDSPNMPIVMLHGFASGLGLWCLSLEPFSQNRPVYAIDILGFGQSSRPEFSKDGLEVEQQIVSALEMWRKQMKLEKFILLGHSMGGYLSMLYAMSYPERVAHLILADTWGFSDKYENPPRHLRIAVFFARRVNPVGVLRCMGPKLSSLILRKTKRDIFGSFGEMLKDKRLAPKYLYYCNATKNPTGEKAFYSMMLGGGWAKNPIIKRINNLSSDVPMTFIYGSKTWMDRSIGPRIKEMRSNSFVDVQIIENAGHHIYSQEKDKFNDIVIRTCELADNII